MTDTPVARLLPLVSDPLVSIVLPVRQEAAYIERCISAVLAQTYPLDRMELIVVDGGSDDETVRIATRCLIGAPRAVVLQNPKGTAPVGMNIGIAHSVGDIIVRVDGHCEIAPDYLERCVQGLRSTGADCVGGYLECRGDTVVSESIACVMSSPFGVGPVAFRTGGGEARSVDTVAFGAYRREVFTALGGFDERLVRHQDFEMNHRLRRSGGTIMFLPEIRAIYYPRSTLLALWRQYRQYGRWKGRLAREQRTMMSIRHFAPPIFVAGAVVGAVAAAYVDGLRVPYFLGLGVYLAIMALAARRATAPAGHRASSGVALLAFASIHIGWGSGWWRGVLSRRDRRAPEIPRFDATGEAFHA